MKDESRAAPAETADRREQGRAADATAGAGGGTAAGFSGADDGSPREEGCDSLNAVQNGRAEEGLVL